MALSTYTTRTFPRKALRDDPYADSMPAHRSKRRAIIRQWIEESDRELREAMAEAFGEPQGDGPSRRPPESRPKGWIVSTNM